MDIIFTMLTLDRKDHDIIAILKQNARLSIREIAKKAKLRPSTVHVRINKLSENKIIERFTLKLNNKALGEDFIVFMLVQSSNEIPGEFFKADNVKEAFGITGEYDIIIKLKFRNIDQFNSFVLDFRKRYKLRKTLTMVATINIKEEI